MSRDSEAVLRGATAVPTPDFRRLAQPDPRLREPHPRRRAQPGPRLPTNFAPPPTKRRRAQPGPPTPDQLCPPPTQGAARHPRPPTNFAPPPTKRTPQRYSVRTMGSTSSFGRLSSVIMVRIVFVIGVLTVACGAGSGSTEDSNGATDSRLPWGDPDLLGIWVNNENTPLERPDPDLDAARLSALAKWFPGGSWGGVAGVNEPVPAPADGARTALVADPPGGPDSRQGGRGGEARPEPRPPDRLLGYPHAVGTLHYAGDTAPAVQLQQRLPDRADRGLRRDHPRDDPRVSHHTAERAFGAFGCFDSQCSRSGWGMAADTGTVTPWWWKHLASSLTPSSRQA